MALDPRTPVIVGAGQLTQRLDDPAQALEPAAMMEHVLTAAADDAGPGHALLERADSVRVVALVSWHYTDPGAAVALRVGASPRETVTTVMGGNSPQLLVNDTARAIQAGEIDVALVAGGEAVYTRRRAREAKVRLPWTPMADAGSSARVLGHDGPGNNAEEMARGLLVPIQVYPLFENALRAAAGESIDEHQVRVSELWARFSEVAAANPYAWSPVAHTAEEIRTVTSENRMIGFPYPKLMNANIDTDQAAGVIMCSVAAARAAGVPEDRWVFPVSGAEAHDHWFVSNRADLHSSPAIRACGRAAFELAGCGADDIAHVDLYSCFPAAVQVGAAELGFGLDEPDRPLTVTGGLGFAGGPANDYSMHAIATMVGRLRAHPGTYGLVSALGWYITKHAIGIYATEPPEAGFRLADRQADVDATPSVEVVATHDGPVTIETYTVMHERDGSPSTGIVACRLPDGRRAWGNVTDPDALKAMTVEEHCGRPAVLGADGTVTITN